MSIATQRAATGTHGLDAVLGGGLPRNRIYLVEGDPGVGKTTLALQFLREGAARGETGLYITLSETEQEIRAVAESHGWSLDGIHLFELSALDQKMRIDSENTIFHPAEVELTETTKALLGEVEKLAPARVVFDSLSELRLLAQSALRYRREVLNLKQYFAGKNSTVLLLDDRTSDSGDMQLQSLAHGVLSLEQHSPPYGCDRRRLKVTKLRGVKFRSGYHDFNVTTGGLIVFPRLIAAEHHTQFEASVISSGVDGLDSLLGGGIDRGTSTLMMGPAGTGKSALVAQYAVAAARRGERTLMFAFDELRTTLIGRADALGMEMSKYVASGHILVQQIDPAEMGPGELAHLARERIEREGVRLVVVDSLNGYMQSMPEERYLYVQMHELLSYFGQRGVSTFLVLAQTGFMGPTMGTPADVSYIADSVVMLRYFEDAGRIRKAISVVKKRSGRHEDTIREFALDRGGIRVGNPLTDFRGVLTGVPRFQGDRTKLET